AGDILDTSIKWTKEYKNNLEKYGINIWSYTVNNLEYMQKLKDFGIQGIESDRPYVAYEFFCNGEHVGYFPEKRITGQWDFLQKNLMGTKGSQMIVRGDTGISGQNVKFGKTSDFKIPLIENKDVDIIKVPAFDSAHYLTFYSNIAPQGSPGGLVCDNNYTLLMDILKPASCKDYISLYQSSCVNEDDGDLFIETKSKGVGILYNYKGIINDSVWYRLAFVFDLPNEKIDEYIDGNHVGTIILENAMDGRFCINNNWGIQPSNLFSDNDGETDNLYVSSIQIRDYVMSKEEIQSLGGVKYNKLSDTIIINQADCPVYSITNKESDVCSGNKATLKINGELNVNYKWQMNSGSGWYDLQENIYTDDTSPDLIIDHVSKEMNNNRFRCIISNDCKVISDEILLGIKAEPQIIQQPISVNVRAGVDTAIDVIATGIELTYQWQIKGETSSWFNLNDNISYSGAKTEKLKIRDVLKESDGNTYRCIIKDSCGIELITEHALLTINTTGTNINRNLRSSILIIQNKGDLKLNFPDYEKVYKYSVCNIIGQVLHEGTVRKSGIVDIHLNTGIYLLKVSDNMHSETIKFVVNEQ
ncbi:MAG: T9SS type A sorting domain-containing protein, partial [Bacteroidota bacterium]|nr:T9SS type A sorting domain-containing protein [Bacteroidota bacterium]